MRSWMSAKFVNYIMSARIHSISINIESSKLMEGLEGGSFILVFGWVRLGVGMGGSIIFFAILCFLCAVVNWLFFHDWCMMVFGSVSFFLICYLCLPH